MRAGPATSFSTLGTVLTIFTVAPSVEKRIDFLLITYGHRRICEFDWVPGTVGRSLGRMPGHAGPALLY